MVKEIVTKAVQFERSLQRELGFVKWKAGNAIIIFVGRKLKIENPVA